MNNILDILIMLSIGEPSASVRLGGFLWPAPRAHLSLDTSRLSAGWCLVLLAGAITVLALIFAAASMASQASSTPEVPAILCFPNANSGPTYFTVHNVYDAWAISKGAGVKVGILDHSFGCDVHPGLYAGGENFQPDWAESFKNGSHHGFWMASTISSTSPVTAGFVAMLRSARPELAPAELKRILMETSRATTFEGRTSPRTVDIAAALQSVTR